MLEQMITKISDWKTEKPVERVGSISFCGTHFAGSKLTIKLTDFEIHNYDEIQIVPVQTGKLLPVFGISEIDEEFISIDLNFLKDYIEGKNNKTYRLALAVRQGQDITFYNLKCKDSRYKKIKSIVADKRCNFSPILWEEPFEDVQIVCQAYFNERSQFMVSLREKQKMHMAQITNELIKVHFVGNRLCLKAKCWDMNEKYTGFVLSYRSKRACDKLDHFVPASIQKQGNYIMLEAQIDIRTVPLKMLYWDIHTVFERDGMDYYVPMKTNNKKMARFYERLLDRYSFKFSDGNIVFAYFTQGNSVALRYRAAIPQDCMRFRMQERIAILLQKLMAPYLKRKNIYLVYEKNSYMAQDNGYYFFKYCMENGVGKPADRNIYYLIDENSPDYHKVEAYKKNVIKFGSLKHMIYLKSARLLISSETKDHAYIWRSMASRLKWTLIHRKLVFLQHGVTAFKKNDFLIDAGKTDGWEMFVVTSEQERDIIAQYYPVDKIKITGFSRWDVLEDCSDDNKQILVMPTWRNWLDDVDDITFEKSEYFQRYKSLLENKKLQYLIQTKDIRLIFYIHPKFREHIQLFSGANIENVEFIAFGELPLNQIMMESKMLITDYSSVSWDMFYQGKPVVFYQFDLDDYNETAGSYIDMKTQLFGERMETEEELLKVLESYIENGMLLKDVYRDMLPKAFSYRDKNNSKRIWEAIITEIDP